MHVFTSRPGRCDGLWPLTSALFLSVTTSIHRTETGVEQIKRKLVGEEPDGLMWELQSGEVLKTVDRGDAGRFVGQTKKKKKKCLIPNFPWRRNSWIYFLLCFLLELNLLSNLPIKSAFWRSTFPSILCSEEWTHFTRHPSAGEKGYCKVFYKNPWRGSLWTEDSLKFHLKPHF